MDPVIVWQDLSGDEVGFKRAVEEVVAEGKPVNLRKRGVQGFEVATAPVSLASNL